MHAMIESAAAVAFQECVYASVPASRGCAAPRAVPHASCECAAAHRSLWSPAALALGPPPGAVGATLNLERLVRQVSQVGGLGPFASLQRLCLSVMCVCVCVCLCM